MNGGKLFYLIFISLFIQSTGLASPGKPFPLGNWRGVFTIRPSVEVPFNFEIDLAKNGKPAAFFLNSDERFEAGAVTQVGDSLFIALDQFDNELAFKIEGGRLRGVLRRQDHTGNTTPVTAEMGKSYRFLPGGAAPAGDISGTYAVSIKSANGHEEKAVGLFKQDGQRLTASFLRITGDSRYLEGVVKGNEFYLSGFIGSSPAYYKGSFDRDGRLNGEIVGSRSSQSFTGIPDETAELPNAYNLTWLKEGYSTLEFSFPDMNGKKVSLSDPRFDGKVVVIAITGTWCPNCMDEAAFLSPWYNANKQRGVEVIALHYERQTDSAFVRKVLTRFKNRFDIQYAQLIAGPADKNYVASSLPALNSFLSFPTTIILDRNKKVVQIHTGYSGPATGVHYEQFKHAFNEQIDALLK